MLVCDCEHFVLRLLLAVSSWECDILSHLLQAQILMAEWQFLPSLIQLHAAHTKLQRWLAAAAVKEVSASLGHRTVSKDCRKVEQCPGLEPATLCSQSRSTFSRNKCPKTAERQSRVNTEQLALVNVLKKKVENLFRKKKVPHHATPLKV